MIAVRNARGGAARSRRATYWGVVLAVVAVVAAACVPAIGVLPGRQHLELIGSGGLSWSAEGAVPDPGYEVGYAEDGALATLRGSHAIEGNDGASFRVDFDLWRVGASAYGSASVTEVGSGARVAGFIDMPAPVIESVSGGSRISFGFAVVGVDAGERIAGRFDVELTIGESTGGTTTTSSSSTTSSTSTTVATSSTTSPSSTTTTTIPGGQGVDAPPVDPSVVTSTAAATEFIYEGDDPIQVDVADGAIDGARAAAVRGRVIGSGGSAIAGVVVTVLGVPELGRTVTRDGGRFDLVVNGGERIVLELRRDGYLPVQRAVTPARAGYEVLDDIVLVRLDDEVTTMDLDELGPDDAASARGSTRSDGDGERTPTIVVHGGTTAEMVMPNGTRRALDSISLRATEYTVGDRGPASMPAELPATSAYTYAAELSVDEAIDAGAASVEFSSPVYHYVENFLGFDVGTAVPVGIYDRPEGRWEAYPDGRVIAIVGEASGRARVDTDGDGDADTAAVLTALGFTDAELEELARLYGPGDELWRAPIPHFSPIDLNFPSELPDDAVAPQSEPPPGDERPPDESTCEASGCYVLPSSQVVGERLPVAGTPYELTYASDRSGAIRPLVIPVTGATVPASLQGVEVRAVVAGRVYEWSPAPTANQQVVVEWDGLDGWGRRVNGRQTVSITIDYAYEATYAIPAEVAASFGLPGNGGTTVPLRVPTSLGQKLFSEIGSFDSVGRGLGGWTIDEHHSMDPRTGKVHLGNGRTLADGPSIGGGIQTVVGPGDDNTANDDPNGVSPASIDRNFVKSAVAPDGRLYLASVCELWRLDHDGLVRRLAGDFPAGCDDFLDGMPRSLVVDAAGNAYVANGDEHKSNRRVFKVDPTGAVSVVAGGGATRVQTGVVATQAELGEIQSITLDSDGKLWISQDVGLYNFGNEQHPSLVMSVEADGTLAVRAGVTDYYPGLFNPEPAPGLPTAEGVRATEWGIPRLSSTSIAGLPNGDMAISVVGAECVIMALGRDGRLTRLAGSLDLGCGSSGNDGPARDAQIDQAATSTTGPSGLVASADGALYFTDRGRTQEIGNTCSVRVVAAGRIDVALGGRECESPPPDGTPALGSGVQPIAIALGPTGSLYLSEDWYPDPPRVRSVTLPGVGQTGSTAVSKDGSTLFEFDAAGRHLRTRDTRSGATIRSFVYDGRGQLSAVDDVDGNRTTIERDGSGVATAVVGPYGHRTALVVDANGRLASVTTPEGDVSAMGYTNDGLMTSFTDPRGNLTKFAYERGLLVETIEPDGGSWTLAGTDVEGGRSVLRTTPEGVVVTYRDVRDGSGSWQRTLVLPDGTVDSMRLGSDGVTTATAPDGTTSRTTELADPRFGLSAPVGTVESTTPGGRTETVSVARSVDLADPDDVLSLVSLTETVTRNGKVDTTTYQAATRTSTATSAGGRTSVIVSDAAGRPVQSQLGALAVSRATYDARGRLAAIAAGAGAATRTVTFTYGADGLLTEMEDASGQVTGIGRDAAGRVTRLDLPGGQAVTVTLDAAGKPTALVPPGRPAHSFAYDSRNRLARWTAPVVGGQPSATNYAYDLDGRLSLVERPNGDRVVYGHDGAGRTTSISGPDGSFTRGYNAATGQLSSASAPGGQSLAMTHDGSLPTGATWSGRVAGTVTQTWNDDLVVATEQVAGTAAVGYGYDADLMLTQAGDLAVERRAADGLVQSTSLKNLQESLSYNEFGEVTGRALTRAGAAIYQAAYVRDSSGRMTSSTETTPSGTTATTFAYDAAGRLATVTTDGVVTAQYTYDGNGNRLSVTRPGGTQTGSYDAQDRITSYGNRTYAHDAAGDLTSVTGDGGTTTFDYDAFSNLRSAELPDGTEIEYVIDGLRRRVGKVVDGSLVQGFLYDAEGRVVAELSGAGGVVSRFVYGESEHVPEYMVKGGTTYRLVGDHVGSVRLVVDATTGAVAQEMRYDEYGRVLADTAPGFQPFGFAGGLYDSGTGLVRFGARDYDATTGRWTTKDPAVFVGGSMNLYSYLDQDPVNEIDPQGLWTSTVARELLNKYGQKGMEMVGQTLLKEGYQSSLDGLYGESLNRDVGAAAFVGMCFGGPLGAAIGAASEFGMQVVKGERTRQNKGVHENKGVEGPWKNYRDVTGWPPP